MNFVRCLMRFVFLLGLKGFARLFYRFEVRWINTNESEAFHQVRAGIFLNHTSLFEPVFCGVGPLSYLWALARHGVFPLADITVNRPIVGALLRLLASDVQSISRRRDATWENFIERIQPHSTVLIAPEGRMKRPSGLDKDGKPMTVRGGIVDVLQRFGHGRMTFCYSGGLHHIQIPGGGFPKLFKTIHVAFETMEISEYLNSFTPASGTASANREKRAAICLDMQLRRDRYCNVANHSAD